MPTLASYATLVGVRLLATKNIGAPHQRSRGTIVGVQSLSSRYLNQARREQHEQGSNPRLRRADQRQGQGSRGQSDRRRQARNRRQDAEDRWQDSERGRRLQGCGEGSGQRLKLGTCTT